MTRFVQSKMHAGAVKHLCEPRFCMLFPTFFFFLIFAFTFSSAHRITFAAADATNRLLENTKKRGSFWYRIESLESAFLKLPILNGCSASFIY